MDKDKLYEIYHQFNDIISNGFLIRKVEEKLLESYVEGKIKGTIHTCVGQEIIGPCFKKELRTTDFVVSNHRGHGHYIAITGNIHGLIAEVMGKKTGMCRGLGGSQHIFDNNFMSNGIQGGMTPIAAGVALANKFKGTQDIVVAFIGDGTLGEGVLYETLNIVSLWQLPVLFVLENNNYAQSTCMKQTFSGSLKKRVEGFGLSYLKADSWDLEALTSSISKAVNLVRSENIPVFLEIETYRLNAHSKGDDNRSEDEVAEYASRDILTQLILGDLEEVKLMIDRIEMTLEEIVREITNVSVAENAVQENVPTSFLTYELCDFIPEDKRINELIYESFKSKFSEDHRYVMLGEDIEYKTQWTANPYGGAFKVSKDLSELFSKRVRNTPISEAAIVGIGTGLALAGFRPIVEIMFGDFITLAFDQIVNHATKFCEMYGKQIEVPLILRTPMGGRRGYGPTHSQSLEKHFLGVPNLTIVALNQRIDPRLLLASVYICTTPSLIIENKVLYTRKYNAKALPGFIIEKTIDKYPTLRIKLNSECSPDITIVCYGGILEEVERAVEIAFDDEEISCEIICPTLINPLNHAPIVESVIKSNKLLVVEEGPTVASLGSEIAANLLAKSIKLTCFRHVGNNSIIPSAAQAEHRLLPNYHSILLELKEMVDV